MIQGILLAAGRSERFGSDKLLHRLGDGTPIALASARTLRMALDNVLVVVRPGAGELNGRLRDDGFDVRMCARADEGMGTSLAFAVAETRTADGWLIALADMPFVRPETVTAIARLIAGGAAIAAPSWRGRRGHPVGFSSQLGVALTGLCGDAGARGLIESGDACFVTYACDDPGCLRDVDYPADLTEPRPAP